MSACVAEQHDPVAEDDDDEREVTLNADFSLKEVHHLLSKRSLVKKNKSHIAKSVRHSEDTAANIVSALGDATPAAGEASVLFRSVCAEGDASQPKKKRPGQWRSLSIPWTKSHCAERTQRLERHQ